MGCAVTQTHQSADSIQLVGNLLRLLDKLVASHRVVIAASVSIAGPIRFRQRLQPLLAGFIGKAIPPRAGGVPYVKER